jgi:predicted nuclease with TOPRIM domain
MHEVELRALGRIQDRLDSLLSELSTLSQRVARIEVQESKVADNSKDINRLEDRWEEAMSKFSRVDIKIAELKQLGPASAKSKALDYAEKGGLVVSGGAVVELLRWLVEGLKN